MMPLLMKKDKVVNKVVLLPVDEIRTNPAQPRTVFDETQLLILADSIRENGLLQPISVRKSCYDDYEIISGERRLRACRLLGRDRIEAIIMERSDRDSAILSMIENIHREDLNIFEQANALKNLIHEWNVTQEEAAIKLGMAQSTLANKIRILKLSLEEQDMILSLGLTERHARALLKIEDRKKRIAVIEQIAKQGLNVSQTEKYIAGMLIEKHQKTFHPIIKDVRLFVNTINRAIDVMKSAGIPASAEKSEEGDYIEYVIKIPKEHAVKRP